VIKIPASRLSAVDRSGTDDRPLRGAQSCTAPVGVTRGPQIRQPTANPTLPVCRRPIRAVT